MERHDHTHQDVVNLSDPNDDLLVMLSTFDNYDDAPQFFSHPSYPSISGSAQPQTFSFPASSSLGRRTIQSSPLQFRGFLTAPTLPQHYLQDPTSPLSRLLHDVAVQPAQPLYRPSDHCDPVDMVDFQTSPGQYPLDYNFFEPAVTAASMEQLNYVADDQSGEFLTCNGVPSTVTGLIDTADIQASDFVLSAADVSTASSEGLEDASSSQEKDAYATSWPEGGERHIYGKSKEEVPGKKMRKEVAKKTKRVRGHKVAIRTKSEVDIIEDGYKWRKYGQKALKNSAFSRNYYRCSDRNCMVKKQVERDAHDPSYVVTTYEGAHNHLVTPTPMQVVHRPTCITPRTNPSSLQLQMELFQMSQNPLEQILLQHALETSRDQGLLEDVLPMELRRRSI